MASAVVQTIAQSDLQNGSEFFVPRPSALLPGQVVVGVGSVRNQSGGLIGSGAVVVNGGATGPVSVFNSTGVVILRGQRLWIELPIPDIGSSETKAESFGASPSASPSKNVEAIQKAVNSGAFASLLSPGTYRVSSTVLLPSNTQFTLGSGVVIKCVVGTQNTTFAPFRNINHNSSPITVVSMTSATFGTQRVRTTVTFASAHGISAGEYVQIKGDAKGIYNGIWLVESAPTATTLTFVHVISSGIIAPPDAAIAVASASQTIATPGVFATSAQTFFAGQAITISGTAPGGFVAGTIYYIVESGLTSTTCQLADSPFATTGKQVTSSAACTLTPVYVGAKADANVRIRGGRVDGDFDAGGFAQSNSYEDHGIILRRVLNPVVEDIELFNFRKYGVMAQDVINPETRNLNFNTGSDGVHIYGPAICPTIENLYGITGDDGAVFQTIDGTSYLQYMLGAGFDRGGDILHGVMRNIRLRHTHNSGSAVLYPNGNSGASGATAEIYRMRGQYLIEATQQTETAVVSGWGPTNSAVIGSLYTTVSGKVESVVIRDCGWPLFPLNSGSGSVVTIDNLVIENPQNDQRTGSDLMGNIDYAVIRTMRVSNANLLNINGNTLVRLNSANASIDTLIFDGGKFSQKGSGGFMLVGSNGGTVGLIQLDGVTFGAGAAAITESHGSFAGTPEVYVNGGVGLSGYLSLVSATSSQNWDIHITDFKSVSPVTGIFNFYGTPGNINLWVKGLQYTGALFANLFGTVTVYNPDGTMPVDLAKLTRTAGQMAKSTGNGTIVANNMAVCDATGAVNSWKQISNTANQF